MNICFFTSEYVSPLRGGVERVTFILYNEFKNRGHNCYIIARDRPISEDILWDGQNLLLNNDVVDSEENVDFVSDFICKNNIQFIVNQSHHTDMFKLGLMMKERYNCKLITVYHTHPLAIHKGIKDLFAEIVWREINSVKRTIRICDWVVRYCYRSYSRKRYIKTMLQQRYRGSDAFVLLSNGYRSVFNRIVSVGDKKLFVVENPMEQKDVIVKEKKKKILWIGRMTFDAKRPDRIIKIWENIFTKCLDWELYMLGDGDVRGLLEQYCEQKNIKNIHFVGNVDPTVYYSEASILCMTSSYEGLPMVLVEALQNRVIPIVYNSIEAFGDIIKDKRTGFVIDSFKKGQYEKKLLELISNKKERCEIVKNIEDDDIFDSLSLDVIYNKWMNLFNQI